MPTSPDQPAAARHPRLPRIAYVLFAVCGVVVAVNIALLLAIGRARSSGSGAGVTAMGVAGSTPKHSASPLTPDANTADLSIPEFTLTTQDGATITRADLLGRVTIVDFFFTHCVFVCPLLTQTMQDQARALSGTPGVKLLSVSVDPVHDTEGVIRRYAAEHGANPAQWTFARGDRETIGRIVTGGLKFAVGENPSQPIKLADGETMSNIVHPPWFVLVGPRAEVLGIYIATDEEEMRALTERARAAAGALR